MGNMVSLHNDWSNIPLDHSVENIYHYTSKIGLDGIFNNGQMIFINRMTNLKEYMY